MHTIAFSPNGTTSYEPGVSVLAETQVTSPNQTEKPRKGGRIDATDNLLRVGLLRGAVILSTLKLHVS